MFRRTVRLSESAAVVSVALAGLLLTAAVFSWMREWEEENVRKNFSEVASATAGAIERNLQGGYDDLRLLKDLFDKRNGNVNREEFRLYTAPLLKRGPFVQGFALHRIVLDRDRDAFEKLRAIEFPGFRIRQLLGNEIQTAERRPFYRVIDFVEPIRVHRAGLGHDAHVISPHATAAALSAEATGQASVAPLLTLPYTREYGFLIFMPLYYTGALPVGWERTRAYAFAVAIFGVSNSVRTALNAADASPFLELKLYGKDAAGWAEAFATPPSSKPRFDPIPAIGKLYDNADMQMAYDFRLLDSAWRLHMALPRASQWEDHDGSLLALASGLVLTLGLSVYAWSNRSSNRRIAALVEQRTLELNDANFRLRDDVSRREAHNRILNMMASGAPLATILDEILRLTESELEGRCVCAVLLSDGMVRGPRLPVQLLAAMAGEAGARAQLANGDLQWRLGHGGLPEELHLRLVDQNVRSLASHCILDKGGHGLGALLVTATEPGVAAAAEAQVLQAATDLMGIAIESRRAEEHVRHLALHDELTGLPNRLSFTEQLYKGMAKADRGGTRLAVMFLDLDRFKYINDHFGHDAGDAVLRSVSGTFRASLREPDVLARIGGDEFMLMVDDYNDSRHLAEIAERLVKEGSSPFEMAGQHCHLGVSIGIAVWPEDGSDPVTLMKNADTAMYRAKTRGRNNYQFFSADMNSEAVSQLALVAGLRRAIDWQEIRVYYQPKLAVESGQIIGLEALVRWQHSEKGLILPGGFVPFAEEIGLISAIGMQVLRIACQDLPRMRSAGMHCGRIAINLSLMQFNDEHLLEDVCEVIADTGTAPSMLEFELTESMVMQNPERAIRTMQELRDMGISLAIDDFGTGYSSLASLKRLPLDRVKVDRSFIEDLTHDDKGVAIVRAVVDMAHTLGLKVVAEGVEKATQLDCLQQIGCDEYQGYLSCEPLPAEQLMARYARLPLPT